MLRWVSRYWVTTCSIAVLGGAVVVCSIGKYVLCASPKLVLESDEIDLGASGLGTRAFQLKVLNVGRGVLKIEKVKSSCGCTIVAACDAIPGGSTGILRGQVAVQPGIGSSKLLLLSNDPDRVHAVNLNWFGKGPPSLVPSEMSVCLRPNERCVRQIRLIHSAQDEVVCQGVSDTELNLDCTIVSNQQARERSKVRIEDAETRTATLSLRFSAPEQPGSYSVKPVLHFSAAQVTSDVSLSLNIEVVGRIHTIPREIFFGAADPDSLVNRRVHLQVVSEGDASDISVISKPEFLECRLVKTEGRLGNLQVTVTSAPPADARDFVISLGDSSGESAAVNGTLIYTRVGFRSRDADHGDGGCVSKRPSDSRARNGR